MDFRIEGYDYDAHPYDMVVTGMNRIPQEALSLFPHLSSCSLLLILWRFLLPASCCLLPASCFLLPASCFLLPAFRFLLLAPCFWPRLLLPLPTSRFQVPYSSRILAYTN
jgi:hypothetical protein